jgi:murein DD-endopeptidase MepM/ murein hydrolase activator NlpD
MQFSRGKRISLIIAAVVILIAIITLYKLRTVSLPGNEPELCPQDTIVHETMTLYGIPIDSLVMETHTIKKNTTLSQMLYQLGATQTGIANVSTLSANDFNVRSIRAGNTCKVFYTPDSLRQLCYFVYERTPVDYSVICFRDSFHVYSGSRDVAVQKTRSSAEISSSLWNAALDSGIDPMLALRLSDIYAWTVDFFGLQKGDRFSVIYDRMFVDSTCIGIGQIYAAEFFHNGEMRYAFHFVQDSVGSYWDETGNSLRRVFLKAPLQFSRISSHFSYARNHPVLRIVRPHTGVDYAAPKGTPVMSIGDGTVIEKGYNGGGGNTVKIRHNSVYTTAYLHLSGYAGDIKAGARVAQGQVIGYVGSTGTSTGPHLDFRVWQNGKPINPLTIESPPVEPVHESNRQAFDSIAHKYQDELKYLPQ